jgi:thiamine-phosphate pyrophosphorylase
LYVLIDGRDDERQFRDLVTALVGAGVQAIQLRDKRLDDRRLWERALLMRELTSQSEILFIVNDRPDLARLAQADGVHVGQEELPAAAARAICGGLVGVSTHSLAQAKQAVADGADYIGVGPTFRTPTKRFSEFPGLELVRTVSQQISLPAFAIGGITLDNLHDVLAAGCRRVAVSSAIVETANPARVARRFLERIAEMYGSTPTT